jgi:hypothetical protein
MIQLVEDSERDIVRVNAQKIKVSGIVSRQARLK